MDNNYLEKEKEKLLSRYDIRQILYYQNIVNELDNKIRSEENAQYEIREGADTNG